jgi:hypothetical protein
MSTPSLRRLDLVDHAGNTKNSDNVTPIDNILVTPHNPAMAKEKVFSEVLNLRVDEAMSKEIKRIAVQREQPESETARMLMDWGIEAHRARETALLRRRYDAGPAQNNDGDPLELRIVAQWVEVRMPWETDDFVP